MYKTDFIVKYNTIENELLQLLEKDNKKLNSNVEANNVKGVDDNSDEEDYKYTKADILNICGKLYRDELISVFDAESIEDPKLEKGMYLLFEKLQNYEIFNHFLQDVGKNFMDKTRVKTEEELFHFKQNSDYFIFITMFSQQMFYMTHQFICKLLVDGVVSNELIEQMNVVILTVITHS